MAEEGAGRGDPGTGPDAAPAPAASTGAEATASAPPTAERRGPGEDLRILPLEAVPADRVLALLRACLGPAAVQRSEAFWRWKHEAGPFGPSPGLVAMAGDRPVAVRTFLRWRWQAGDRTFRAVRAVDTATHPQWRRRGLFRRLTTDLLERVEEEGAAFVFNTPNATSRAGYLALGWRDLGRVPVLLRPRRPARLLAAGLGRERRATGAEPELPGLEPLTSLLDDPALPGFLDDWNRGEERLHTPRSVDYLTWRYATVPGIPYRAAWDLQGRSGAVAVVRPRRRRGLAEVALVELLASHDGTGRRAARELVGRIAATPGVDHLVAVASPGSDERRVLLRSGFLPLPAGPRWVARPLAPLGSEWKPKLFRRRSWRVSAGDLELF